MWVKRYVLTKGSNPFKWCGWLGQLENNNFLLQFRPWILTKAINFQHSLLAREVLFILSLKINLLYQSIGLSVITQGRDQMYKSHHKERYIASNSSHKPKTNGIKVNTQLTMGSINEAKLSNHMQWFLSQAQWFKRVLKINLPDQVHLVSQSNTMTQGRELKISVVDQTHWFLSQIQWLKGSLQASKANSPTTLVS